MLSQQKSVACPFCQQPVKFPPTFNDTLQCVCGAKYHHEFGSDLCESVWDAQYFKNEYDYIFVGAAKWIADKSRSKRSPKKRLMKKLIKKCGPWFDVLFSINYDVKEENLLPHEDKIYLFFTK